MKMQVQIISVKHHTGDRSRVIRPVAMKFRLPLCLLLVLLEAPALIPAGRVLAQRGSVTLFGDMKVDESKAGGMTAMSFNVILYNLSGNVRARQTVPSVASTADFRRDLEFEWKPGVAAGKQPRAQTASAADVYDRAPANQKLFNKAGSAIDGKKYEEAVSLRQLLLAADSNDFQAWTELGTVHLLRDKAGEAEKAYRRAIEARPAFGLALLNLGRVLASQKKFEEAVEPLTRAVE
jgi:hypothetical protein